MAKKKEETEVEELSPFEYDSVAYLPVFNKARKHFDMWKLLVNTTTQEVILEIEETRYDSTHRAHHDLLKRIAEDSKVK